jgi:acyl-CoA dehydrogenase
MRAAQLARSATLALRRPPDDLAGVTRRLVQEVLTPAAVAVDEAGTVPDDLRRRLADLGYFGLRIPERYGGSGLDLVPYLGVVRELARTNLAFQELTEENNGIGSAALVIAGSEEQRARWLGPMACGEAVGAFALTEPGAGADAAGITTRATPSGDGFLLNGTKHFITHGALADVVTVVARVGDAADRSAGVTLFLVTPDNPGFAVGRVQAMMGYRASHQAELRFDDAYVDRRDVVGQVGEGFTIAMQTLDTGRLTVAADCLGAGEELLDRTLAYAGERRTFGKRLVEHGQVREMLARSAMELLAVERALFALAARVDAGEPLRSGSAAVKLLASEVVGRVADRAMQVHGGLGYTVEAEIERFYRDVRVLRIAEGPSEVLRNSIARAEAASARSRRETLL